MAHETMRIHLAALALLLVSTLLPSCVSRDEGTFEIVFSWSEPPATPVWLWARVENRPLLETKGSTLASTAAVPWTPGGTAALVLTDVPNGSDRRVIVEVREAADEDLRVLYYGISDTFTLAPGEHPVVDVPLLFQRPQGSMPADQASVELLFAGQTRTAVALAALRDATLRLRVAGASALKLANDPSFSAGYRLLPLDGEGDVACAPGGGAGEAQFETCTVEGWDLSAGLPATPDGVYSVYVRLVDPFGYESETFQASVFLDTQAPVPLVASVTPPVAGPGQTVLVTVNFQEALAASADAATLSLSSADGGATPAFEGPQRIGDSTAYLWRGSVSATDDGRTFALAVAARDAQGNQGTPIPLADDRGTPLELIVDGTAPSLAAALEPSGLEFGIERPGDDERNRLSFDFALLEPHPGVLSEGADGGCEGACPEVLLDGRALGLVTRTPDADDEAAERLAFRYSYDVRSSDWGAVEKDAVLSIRWRDAAANEGVFEHPQPVRLDFARPTATCEVTPSLAAAADRISLVVRAREPLAEAPVVKLEPAVPLATPPDVDADERTFGWALAAADVPDGPAVFSARLVDRFGNASDGDACVVPFEVDATAPVLAEPSIVTVPEVRDAANQIVLAVGADDRVAVSFTIVEARGLASGGVTIELLSTNPGALAFGAPTLEDLGNGSWRATAELPIDGVAHALEEGTWPVAVRVTDEAGNNTAVQSLVDEGLVRVDLTPPQADCSLIPPPEAGTVPIGQTVSVNVFPFEELDPGVPPTLDEALVPALAGGLLHLVPGSRYRFAHAVSEGDGERTFEARFRLRDLVGNETAPGDTACAGGAIEGSVDGLRPALVSAALAAPQAPVDAAGTARARAGVRVEATLVLAGDPAASSLSVTLGGGAAVLQPGWPRDAAAGQREWRYARTLTGQEPEGPLAVRVSGTDPAGNAFVAEAAEPKLVADFTAPEAECFVNLGVAKVGDTLRLNAAFSEPVLPATFALESDLDFAPASGATAPVESALFTHIVPVTSTREAWSYTLNVADVAGNVAPFALCEGGGLVDGDPIDVQILRAEAAFQAEADGPFVPTGLLARHGSRVEVELSLDQSLEGGSLTVRLGDDTLPCLVDGLAVTCTWTVDATAAEPAQPEGPAPLTIEAWDDARNRTYLSPASFQRDFTPPSLTGTPYFARADGSERARLALNDVFARPDTRVAVSFALSEAPAGAPTVQVDGLEVAVPSWSAGDRVVQAEVPERAADLVAPVTAQVVDLAGNPASLDLGILRYDATPPDGLGSSTQGSVRLVRAPWGAASPAQEAGDELHVCGAPVHADDFAWCDADAALWVEAGSQVSLFRTESTGATRVCTDALITWFDAPGAVDARVAVPGDWPAVCASVTDRAGNESTAALVEGGRWRATLRGKRPGSEVENPHALRRVWRSRPEQRDQWPDAVEPDRAGYELVGAPDDASVASAVRRAWSEVVPGAASPAARAGHAIALDTARGRAVLFGGDLYSRFGQDTWEWDGRVWRDVSPLGGNPAPRFGHGLAYDAQRGRTVLYGGTGFDASIADELWEWDGDAWAPIEVSGPTPGGRARAAFAYDPLRGRIVLFGGLDPDGRVSGGTWAWDGSAWTDVSSPSDPSPRAGASMAWDAPTESLVLFGGCAAYDSIGQCTSVLADTWVHRDGAWAQLVGSTASPSGRHGHLLVADPRAARLVLTGGTDDTAVPLTDTWSFEGGAWAPVATTAGSPGERRRIAGFADPVTGAVTLVGGYAHGEFSDTFLGDVWRFEGDTWRDVTPSPSIPGYRGVAALAYDALRQQSVLFGGAWWKGNSFLNSQLFDETWVFDAAGWHGLAPAEVRPVARIGHALAFDRGSGSVLLYGGLTPSGLAVKLLRDTWAFDGTAWTELVPTTLAPTLAQPTLAHDDARGVTVLFGGCRTFDFFGRCSGYSNETWEWNGADWTKRTPATSPLGRMGAAMAYDAARGRTVLFGGCKAYNISSQCTWTLGDTWEWNGEAWTAVAAPGQGPSARYASTLAYDPDRARTILYGGERSATLLDYADDVWEWDGATWVDVTGSEGPRLSRTAQSLAYDEREQGLVLMGGFTSSADGTLRITMDDTWTRDLSPDRRPAAWATFAFGKAEVPPDLVTSLGLVARAGGRGFTTDLDPHDDGDLVGEALAGVELRAWDAQAGEWLAVAATTSDSESPGWLVPAPAEGDAAFRLVATRDRSVDVLVTPTNSTGNGGATAEVTVDYLELSVDYRWPTP